MSFPFRTALLHPRDFKKLCFHFHLAQVFFDLGLPQWLSGKESACNVGAAILVPWSGRSPGGGHGNPL